MTEQIILEWLCEHQYSIGALAEAIRCVDDDGTLEWPPEDRRILDELLRGLS